MTPKISLVAVCCSNDFLEFLEQPHILDSDHGLVGEGFQELDLRRGEGTYLGATCVQRSDEFPLLTKGSGSRRCAKSPSEPSVGKSFCARTSGMWSVPCSRIQRNCGSSILISTRPNGYGTKMSPRNHHLVLAESQLYVINPTNPAALSTIASSTGCTSVGERLMMPSTSAVAV